MAYSAIARFGVMQNIGTFKTELSELRMSDRVIVRTDRGTELGVVVAAPDEVKDGFPEEGYVGTILRKVAAKDLERQAAIESTDIPAEFQFCEQKIAEHNLPMKLATVEHLFGGEKIIFYYLADGRVDFRQLVKDLAGQYRTRIEMRQIGVRDEARLLADYEHCGQEICCRRFMRNLEPVTMRMAKSQKTTLDPSKISGRCGRLMCCLRFEDETYAALRENLPRRGSRVRTSHGWGEVMGGDILQQTVLVQLESGTAVTVKIDQILEQQARVPAGRGERQPPEEEIAPEEAEERELAPPAESDAEGPPSQPGEPPHPA